MPEPTERLSAAQIKGLRGCLMESPNQPYSAICVSALLDEIERLRIDEERVDWRETHPNHGFGLYSNGQWADGKGGKFATYREAIDSARAVTGGMDGTK